MAGEEVRDHSQIPARADALPVSVSVLQHMLNAVLTYHYGQSNRTQPAENKRLIEAINKYLGEVFFDELFVLRPDIKAALRKITLEPLCVLHGGRGAGKTTSILYIIGLIMRTHEPSSDVLEIGIDSRGQRRTLDRTDLVALLAAIRHDPNWYFSLDVEESRNELSESRTICHFLFDGIYERATSLLEGFEDTWEDYLRVRYAPLKNAIKALESTIDLLGGRGIEIPAEVMGDVSQSLLNARSQFNLESGTFRVEVLLEFLDRTYGVAVGFAVDNIDLFDEALQKDVALAMFNLCYTKKLLQHSIVGVRSENLPVIFDALKGHTGLSNEDAIDVSIRTEGFEVLLELLRKRLNVMPEILQLPAVQETYRQQRESGYLPEGDPSENVEALFTAVDVVRGLLAPSHDRPPTVPLDSTADKNYLTQLLQWNNNSLRAVLTASYHVGFLIASDSDPTFSFSQMLDHRRDFADGSDFDGERFGKLVRARVRFCRSFFIRQFVATSVQSLEFSHDLLLYEKPTTPVPESQLPYLRLHILQALARRGEKATIDDLCSLLRPFGSMPRRTKEALEGLRQPAKSRRPDDRGLIHIDSGSRADDAPGTVTVTLLPAGRHMVDDLCYMSDYIFWNAFNTYNASNFLGARREDVTPSQLADERYRIEVSLAYLEKRILPRYLGIFELETYQPGRLRFGKPDIAQVLTDYLDTFGFVVGPVGIAEEIADFAIKGRSLSQEFKIGVQNKTSDIKNRAQQPFFDVNLRRTLTSRRSR